MSDVPWLCECNSHECALKATLTMKELQEKRKLDLILIVDGCKRGPEPTDVLVKTCKGYKLYEESL